MKYRQQARYDSGDWEPEKSCSGFHLHTQWGVPWRSINTGLHIVLLLVLLSVLLLVLLLILLLLLLLLLLLVLLLLLLLLGTSY